MVFCIANRAYSGGWTTPLHIAATQFRVDIIRLLIQHGANLKARDYKGRTPLFLAIVSSIRTNRDQQLMCLKVLLDAGADIDAIDGQKMTPLAFAAYFQNIYVAEYLLGRGAKLEVSKYVALRSSLTVWNEKIFLLLLSHPDIRERTVNMTASDLGTCFDGQLLNYLQSIVSAHIRPALFLLAQVLASALVSKDDAVPSHLSDEVRVRTQECRMVFHGCLRGLTGDECMTAYNKLAIARALYEKRTSTFVPVCAHCNLPALLACSGCYLTLYCSYECQKKSWRMHRKECCL